MATTSDTDKSPRAANQAPPTHAAEVSNYEIVSHYFEMAADRPDFHIQVASLFAFVKSAPLAQGAKEILIPGEPEARLEAERRRDGIPIEDETWNQIERVAAEVA